MTEYSCTVGPTVTVDITVTVTVTVVRPLTTLPLRPVL